MARPANDWISGIAKNIKRIIKLTGAHTALITGEEARNPSQATALEPANKLTGTLKIEDYPDLEKIILDDNEIEELIIKNCPKLKIINFDSNRLKKVNLDEVKFNVSTNKAEDNILLELWLGNNDIREIGFTYCKELEKIYLQNNPNLEWLRGLDKLEKLSLLNKDGNGKIASMHSEKLGYYKGLAEVNREILGIGSEVDLPPKSDLKDQIVGAAAPQLQSKLDQTKKEAKANKEELSGVETEKNQLKQQWEAIRTELGLGNNSTQQQIIERIKELKGRPTTSCTHSDYDTIKSQRDSLQTEVESKKRKISELEDTNKENVNIITKKVLVDTTNTNWKNWGIELSSEQKQKIQEASSAEELETVRSEIISNEFSRLKGKGGSSAMLSIGLGVLAIGSLLILAWVLMRQNNNFLQDKPKKEKEK